MADRPVVTTDPAVKFGEPTVEGRPVEALASQIYAGDSLDSVATGFDLTREQVLVACWHQGHHGPRFWRRRWGAWAAQAHKELWNSRYDIPDPPSREEQLKRDADQR
jgi:uncharacterized protein (DUF433 family)